MRLLNTSSIQLEELPDNAVPSYAILSHCWGEEEVLFHELDDPTAMQNAGYAKITSFCAQAASDGVGYVWIDTCCIDKASSAELSEAINSMYRWYQNALVCYAYLVDVPSDEDPRKEWSAFRNSRWFTRGWTLQELLAPHTLVFYAKDWVEIGTKSSLQDTISAITGIDNATLMDNSDKEISVATKMSWASRRLTTRVEDMAYSLMGLFGVNMPPLYGEGENAFMRLQLEIMKSSDDQTIFAWKEDPRSGVRSRSEIYGESGLLARSPADFVQSGRYCRRHDNDMHLSPYSMTNFGLCIELPLVPYGNDSLDFLAHLNCGFLDHSGVIGIHVRRKARTQSHFVRTKVDEVLTQPEGTIPAALSRKVIYVREPSRNFDFTSGYSSQESFVFAIGIVPVPEHGFSATEIYPEANCVYEMGIKKLEISLRLGLSQSESLNYLARQGKRPCGALVFRNKYRETFTVVLGARNGNVWSDVVINSADETLDEICTSYYRTDKVEGGRYLMPYRNLDRVTKFLLSGKAVSVAIRKLSSSKRDAYYVVHNYTVDIVIK